MVGLSLILKSGKKGEEKGKGRKKGKEEKREKKEKEKKRFRNTWMRTKLKSPQFANNRVRRRRHGKAPEKGSGATASLWRLCAQKLFHSKNRLLKRYPKITPNDASQNGIP